MEYIFDCCMTLDSKSQRLIAHRSSSYFSCVPAVIMFHLLLQAVRSVFAEFSYLKQSNWGLLTTQTLYLPRDVARCGIAVDGSIQKKFSHVCDDYGDSFIDDTWCP